jgi:hypothetical protein
MATGDNTEPTQNTQGIMDLGWTQDEDDSENEPNLPTNTPESDPTENEQESDPTKNTPESDPTENIPDQMEEDTKEPDETETKPVNEPVESETEAPTLPESDGDEADESESEDEIQAEIEQEPDILKNLQNLENEPDEELGEFSCENIDFILIHYSQIHKCDSQL